MPFHTKYVEFGNLEWKNIYFKVSFKFIQSESIINNAQLERIEFL